MQGFEQAQEADYAKRLNALYEYSEGQLDDIILQHQFEDRHQKEVYIIDYDLDLDSPGRATLDGDIRVDLLLDAIKNITQDYNIRQIGNTIFVKAKK